MTVTALDERRLMSATDVAAACHVSTSTVSRWRLAGIGPAPVGQVGRTVLYDADQVTAFATLRLGGHDIAAPYEVIAPPDLSREDWLAFRKVGLGGSDAAAAFGLDPYRSEFTLWLEKTGRWNEDDAGEAAEWGNRLEPYVMRRYADAHPEVAVIPAPGMLRSKSHPVMLANLDRFAVTQAGEVEVLEAKAPGLRQAKHWPEDELPDHYVVQVMHYLAVTGAPRARVAALIGGQTYIERTVERDDELIAVMQQRLTAWWQRHVIEDVPPDVDGTGRTAAILGRLYEVDPESVADLPVEADDILLALADVKAQAASLDDERGLLENRLKELMGPCELGLRNGRQVVTYKQNGTFAPTRFEKDHPDLARRYATTKPALDTKALAKDHPEIYTTYRGRVLRPKEL